jgi:succinyl-CoA synthetase beta subunit
MANKKISELPLSGALTGDEKIEGVQNGDNVQMTAQDIADLGGGGASETLDAGTYSPSTTNVLNVSASLVGNAQYMRVGEVVTVSGSITIDAVATGVAQVRIPLPIPSDLASSGQLAGVVVSLSSSVVQVGSVYADTVNNEAFFYVVATQVSSVGHTFTFTYVII